MPIRTTAQRIADQKKSDPIQPAVESQLMYERRIRNKVREELIALVRGTHHSAMDRFEACAQLFEFDKLKTEY